MKKTAVEWLVEKLQESGISLMKDEFEMIEQAKEMEKEEPKQEISYSKEEVIKFAKWCAELKVWDNQTYVNNTFEELLQQFKNK